MLIRRRKKEDADDIVTRVGDYNNAAGYRSGTSGLRCFVRRFLFDASRLSDGFFGFYFVRRLSEVPHQRALLLCPPRDFACGGALRRLYCLAYSDEGLEEDGVPVLPIRALPARRGVYSGHR